MSAVLDVDLQRWPGRCESCQQARWSTYLVFLDGRGFFLCGACACAVLVGDRAPSGGVR